MPSREIKDEKQMMPDMASMSSSVIPSSDSQTIQIQISEEFERAIVQTVKEDYGSFKESRDNRDYGKSSKGETLNFDKWFKSLKDSYTGEREPKDIPWQFCSNRSLRMATSIVDLLSARLLPAIINEDLLRFRPGEISDVPKKERIEKFMVWWVFINSKLQDFFDKWIKTNIAFGDSLVESYYERYAYDSGETQKEPIMDEMGQQIQNPDGSPAFISSRKLVFDERTCSKTYTRDQFYMMKGSSDLRKDPVIIEEEWIYRNLEQGEVEGKFINVTNLLKERILETVPQVGLNSQEEEQLRLVKIRNKKVKVLREYLLMDINNDGIEEDIRVFVVPDYDIYLGGVLVKDITFSGKRPLTFSKYDNRLNDADELFGEGVLEKIKELSQEIDAIFNQMTDANTLSILKPGYYDPSGDLDAPVLKLAPNRLTPVTDPSRNIYFPDQTIDINRLINAIRLVLEFIERLTAASSYVLGRESEIVGGSGTATRTNAIMQSAEQRFELPARRLRRSAEEIINTHLDLVQLNVPPGLETRILGEKGEPLFGENELTQQGIAGKFDAYLMSDPADGSKQTERDLASMFYSVLSQNMLVGTDPAKIYKITADFIKSYGKDPIEYLGPEPSTDDIDDPETENTLIVQGDFERVRAQISENHILHIKVHQDLLMSPSLAQLAQAAPHLHQQVMEYTQMHIEEHMQQMQAVMGLLQKFGGKGGMNGQPGEPARNAQGTEGSTSEPRMENVSGPMGQALNQKRTGQVSSSSA